MVSLALLAPGSFACSGMGCTNSAACTGLSLRPALSFIMNHSADAARLGWALCLLVSYRRAIRARLAKGAMLASMTGLGAQGANCCWAVSFIVALGTASDAELGLEKNFRSERFTLAAVVLAASTKIANCRLEVKCLSCGREGSRGRICCRWIFPGMDKNFPFFWGSVP